MEIKTYSDLEEHLLATMDSFSDQMCESNRGISKESYWNLCMKICINEPDKHKQVDDIVIKNVLTEFPEYSRVDYVLPYTEEDMASDIW